MPVFLMLGSVYLHTVSARTGDRVAGMEQKLDRAQEKQRDLDVKIADLSRPERVRSLAREDLGMKDPAARDFAVDEAGNGENGRTGAGRAREDR